MALISDRIADLDVVQSPTKGPKRPGLAIVAIVLGLAVIVLTGWLVYELNSGESETTPVAPVVESAAPLAPEVESLFDAYLGAWSSGDRNAFEQVITDDFTILVGVNQWLGDQIISYAEPMNATQAAAAVHGEEWSIEQVGSPIVARQDPWFLSVTETWKSSAFTYQGTASYVIERHDGELLVASHYWIGLQEFTNR